MVRKKEIQPKKLLTDPELELMQALWDLKEATVREVMDRLPEKRWAYTTVATVFKVLEKKGVVRGVKNERAHTYVPIISRETYETKTIQHIVNKVFRGETTSFAMKLLNETILSPKEIESLREILNKGTKQ